MKNKSLVVIIGVVILVIIAIALLFSYIISGGSLKTEDLIGKAEEEIKPVIELTLNSEEYTFGNVIINVSSYMEDGSEIDYIILPNYQEVISSTTRYEVTKNGDYEFIAKAKNGQESKKTISINTIIDSSPDAPYIPEGFRHVEGTEVESGYTIIDDYGNEFVWIPIETGKLIRETEGNLQYDENVSEINELSQSVLRYYGFYIAKYEASEIKINEKETIASKKDVIPLSNINYNIAYEKAQKMYQIYNYSDSKTALINSYAWDTTLKWIDNNVTNYSKNISYGNYSGIINLTGNTDTDIVNNICDLSGNLREWTTEIYYVENDISVLEEKDVYRVIRGGSANIEKAASSHIVYPDTMTDTYWGFRVVLYKK